MSNKFTPSKKRKASEVSNNNNNNNNKESKIKKEPRTLENTREFDETIVTPDDEEVLKEDSIDEFSNYFSSTNEPKLLITTSKHASLKTLAIIDELLTIFPNAHFYKRRDYEVKEIVKFAKNREFTDLMVINEDNTKPNALVLVHLPEGPTAHFKLSSYWTRKQLRHKARPENFKPEVILNNFNTRLGHTIGRMFASLFPQKPEFKGRSVATFHNQRDFIFFRFHKYVFNDEKEDVRIQEMGPRFCLKLRSLQHGTFDPNNADFIWVHKTEMDTSRRRFFL